MTTVTVTRRAPAMPCQMDPPRWDIERGVDRGYLADHVVARLANAVAICHRCPLLEECELIADKQPPTHPCVMAARVYDGGKAYEPAAWIAEAQRAPAGPLRVCDRITCGATFSPRQGQQRYCGQLCARAQQSANKRQRNKAGRS